MEKIGGEMLIRFGNYDASLGFILNIQWHGHPTRKGQDHSFFEMLKPVIASAVIFDSPKQRAIDPTMRYRFSYRSTPFQQTQRPIIHVHTQKEP